VRCEIYGAKSIPVQKFVVQNRATDGAEVRNRQAGGGAHHCIIVFNQTCYEDQEYEDLQKTLFREILMKEESL